VGGGAQGTCKNQKYFYAVYRFVFFKNQGKLVERSIVME
jgi:hypothetical protein